MFKRILIALATILVSNNTPVIAGYWYEFPIATSPIHQHLPDIYGDIVVWQEGRGDLKFYNLSTSSIQSIVSGSAAQEKPSVYNNMVVWSDFRGNQRHIYGYDIDKSNGFLIHSSDSQPLWKPEIYGNNVTWYDPSHVFHYLVSRGFK
jgi:beta propeller repeat protein